LKQVSKDNAQLKLLKCRKAIKQEVQKFFMKKKDKKTENEWKGKFFGKKENKFV